jgi:hypothetical protein
LRKREAICSANVRWRTETKAWLGDCLNKATNNRRGLYAPGEIKDHPVTHRYSIAGLGTACFALLVGSAILVLNPAHAAPKKQPRANAAAIAKSVKAKFAQTEPATTGSIAKPLADAQPACDKARRRLWVEGEGWVVRRVTTC